MKKNLNVLSENTGKYKTFPFPVTNEVNMIDKNRKESTKTISSKLPFIVNTRFLASSLLNLVDNLPEAIHKPKCKCGHDNEKCEKCVIKYIDWECFRQYTST